jgi:uncharacterized protein YndB with AHSA1/START domain
MIKSKVTFLINQPLEQVFQYTTNPDHFSLWMPGLVSAGELSTLRLEDGTTFKMRHKEGGRIEDLMARVMLFVPNQKLSILATGQKLWFRRTWEFRTRALGTEVLYTEERADSGVGLSIMFFVVSNMYQNLSEESCENLRKLIENNHFSVIPAS